MGLSSLYDTKISSNFGHFWNILSLSSGLAEDGDSMLSSTHATVEFEHDFALVFYEQK
jgi:hypothetical protein